MITIDELTSRLHNIHRTADGGFVASCPAHDDDKPSLKVSTGSDGRILLHCHAGCTIDAVTDALGITKADLMPERERIEFPKELMGSVKSLKTGVTAKQPKLTTPSREVAHYDYVNENGTPVYRVIRLEPKSFRQAKILQGGKLSYSMSGVTRYPYHIDEVLRTAASGGEIVICEGEKDADNIRKLGMTATCNAGGAGKFDPTWAKYFKGASTVYIVADNDPKEKNYPGQRHAWKVKAALDAAGVMTDILTMPTGKDATDFIEAVNPDAQAFHDALAFHEPWPDEWKFTDTTDTLEADADDQFKLELKSIDEFPEYKPEDEDDTILIKGRWLERGGSAWWVSTAGTGKSIVSVQLAFLMSAGLPFAGFKPRKKPKFWVIQSEDSPTRVTIDREDITTELKEQHPEIDWAEVRKNLLFLKVEGKSGADFIDYLDRSLEATAKIGKKPDIVIINPFLAYVGGPVTDGAYVTPFLRGGIINRKPTPGLQYVLEKHGIGALIFHHTPKPPTGKELTDWMKSAFPEYQGAGSSDITNWGRSFVTMMRCLNDPTKVCITAGKNGGELGWRLIDGGYRHYLAWSGKTGITGHNRHAWRELTEEELAEITKDALAGEALNIKTIVDALKASPMTWDKIREAMIDRGMKVREFNSAWKIVSSAHRTYGLACVPVQVGHGKHYIFGVEEAAKEAAFTFECEEQND